MLPDYTIRESSRAKHVRLHVTSTCELVVVIPQGFDRRRIPELVASKREWVKRAMAAIDRQRGELSTANCCPPRLDLAAIGQVWEIVWTETDAVTFSVEEGVGFELRLSGPISHTGAWRAILRAWLMARARETFIPWVKEIARDLGIPIRRIVVRCQKTRWGSYSSRGTVSLNAQLLFLPRDLARYVLIHEVCHAAHPDHSSSFWELVRRWEPAVDRLRSELKTAGRWVPAWLRLEAAASSPREDEEDL